MQHVYLLIEFQSSVDTSMAVRVLAYVALLYQDLLRTRQIDLKHGLPAIILPVVLHNGSKRWYATEDIDALLAPTPRGAAARRAASDDQSSLGETNDVVRTIR